MSKRGGAGRPPAPAAATPRGAAAAETNGGLPVQPGGWPGKHILVRQPVKLTLRDATPADLGSLTFFFDTALRRDYFLRRGQLKEMLCSNRHRVFIAAFDCVLVGVVILTRGQRLVNALVHPGYRGLGIGRALVEHCAPREVRTKLNMRSGDPGGFYRRLGFAPTGLRNRKATVELYRRVKCE